MRKIGLKIIFIVTIGSFFSSCRIESKFYSLYSNSFYDVDVSLFINYTDSTYIYMKSLHSANIDYKEIGRFRINKDTIILIPACEISSDTVFYMCRYYNCKNSMYANKSEVETGNNRCINNRLYIKTKDTITDCTLDYYYPEDSTSFTFYEQFPLIKCKIQALKKEKSVIYSRKVIDRIW